jgi:2-methylcitrate dehydratase PrpD
VGQFRLGANPKVNAQFSVGYCVANALTRSPVKLIHFEPEAIKDPTLLQYLEERVEVISDESIAATRGHYSSDLVVKLKDGRVFKGSIDIPPGTPAYPMTDEEHTQRFYDCVRFANEAWLTERADNILKGISELETQQDVRDLFSLLQC